jgi:subtilisin family serine protease
MPSSSPRPGNSGVDTPFFPAACAEVIGVAATDEADALYSWSNHGDSVRVAAPGCNTATWLGGGYVEFCSTSSAAPVVSAIAGLALPQPRPPACAVVTAANARGSATAVSGASAVLRAARR